MLPGSVGKFNASVNGAAPGLGVGSSATNQTMSHYNKLYTPEDSAAVFIDHQPQMTFGVANIERASLINNVTLLAKVAKELTSRGPHRGRDRVVQRLRLAALLTFSRQEVLERTSMNSWDDEGFRGAIKATGRKTFS